MLRLVAQKAASLMAVEDEDKSQVSSCSIKDEEEAQKELHRLSKRLRKNVNFKTTRNWTGFQGKTVWDWLQLLAVLAIPLILGIATLLFGLQQAHLADLQHQSDQKLAQQQHDADQLQALEQQRQATLMTYEDNMKDLLLNRGLLTSKLGDEVRVIAKIETLSAMRQLDGKRNSFLIQFLRDAHLIGFHSGNIVSFEAANLSFTDLKDVDLNNVTLLDADFHNSTLLDANLNSARLNSADLYGALQLHFLVRL